MSSSTTAATHAAHAPDASDENVKDTIVDQVKRVATLLEQFAPVKTYVWREIERDTEDEDGNPLAPLRVRVVDLTTAQTEAIPWGTRVALRDSYRAIAPYVVEWDLQAENLNTGEIIPVPPPAEAGWEILELLTTAEGSALVNWIMVPHFMKAEATKKSQTPSTTTTGRPKRKR